MKVPSSHVSRDVEAPLWIRVSRLSLLRYTLETMRLGVREALQASCQFWRLQLCPLLRYVVLPSRYGHPVFKGRTTVTFVKQLVDENAMASMK